jgi:uncharacterized ParB-like nuclease family protein/FtsZ-binding cell division protein ZapB
MKKLNLNLIRIDGGTQPREQINTEAVGDYAEAVKVGIEFPPVVVFHDGKDYWLADGFHRYHAHKQTGKASIVADVREGTLLDALIYAVGANGAHGLRRTNEDKRRAVMMVLERAELKDWSDRKIADACAVSHPFVAALRRPEPAKVVIVTTRERAEKPQQGGNDYQPGAVKGGNVTAPKRSLDAPAPADVPPPAASDQLNEAQHAITELAQENETLRDRLAVEAMDASESEKTLAAETITELRAQVKALEVELDAVKKSRDSLMRTEGELKKQVSYWRKKAEKAEKVTA